MILIEFHIHVLTTKGSWALVASRKSFGNGEIGGNSILWSAEELVNWWVTPSLGTFPHFIHTRLCPLSYMSVYKPHELYIDIIRYITYRPYIYWSDVHQLKRSQSGAPPLYVKKTTWTPAHPWLGIPGLDWSCSGNHARIAHPIARHQTRASHRAWGWWGGRLAHEDRWGEDRWSTESFTQQHATTLIYTGMPIHTACWHKKSRPTQSMRICILFNAQMSEDAISRGGDVEWYPPCDHVPLRSVRFPEIFSNMTSLTGHRWPAVKSTINKYKNQRCKFASPLLFRPNHQHHETWTKPSKIFENQRKHWKSCAVFPYFPMASHIFQHLTCIYRSFPRYGDFPHGGVAWVLLPSPALALMGGSQLFRMHPVRSRL